MPAPRLDTDASHPYQLGAGLLAIWLPRGRGREDRAPGLISAVTPCPHLDCGCSVARLGAIVADDRVVWAKHERGSIELRWRDACERERSFVHHLDLDFVTGEVTDARGGELPREVRPFFREPVPAWVLDDLHAAWAAPRALPDEPRWDELLAQWEPGILVPRMSVAPAARDDVYVHDGAHYGVDVSFCVRPDCECTDTRISVFAIGDGVWREIASAGLDAALQLRDVDADPGDVALLCTITAAWRARAGNPGERIAQLRAEVRSRGRELHRRWDARRVSVPATAPAVASLRAWGAANAAPLAARTPAVGRNATCPCGSGKKYKRCCGR